MIMFPSAAEWQAMAWSFVRFFAVSFIAVVLTAGGFGEVDLEQAAWAGLVSGLGVIVNWVNPKDERYGVGA